MHCENLTLDNPNPKIRTDVLTATTSELAFTFKQSDILLTLSSDVGASSDVGIYRKKSSDVAQTRASVRADRQHQSDVVWRLLNCHDFFIFLQQTEHFLKL